MADVYWVGGSGNWSDNTNHWSATTGGPPGAAKPVTGDNAIFDTLSNATGYTITFDEATAVLTNLTMGAPASGVLTKAGTGAINLTGNFSLATGSVWGALNNFVFSGTTGGTIDANGIQLAGFNTTITFSPASAASWQFLSGWNTPNGTFTVNSPASIDTNGQTITAGLFSIAGAAGSRSILFGASTINADNFGILPTGTLASFTFDPGTSTLVTTDSQSTGSTPLSLATGLSLYNVTVGTPLALATDITLTGTFTATGSDADDNRKLVLCSPTGTPRTLTAATVSITNTDFSDVVGAGAGTWSGTSIGDELGNSGITFTTPVTRYAVGANWNNTNSWSTSSGGATGASVPLAQDTVHFDASSISMAVNSGMRYLGTNIDFAGYTQTITFQGTAIRTGVVLGNLTLASGQASPGLGSSPTVRFAGRSSHTITSAGKTFANAASIEGFGGNYALADALTLNGGALTLTRGTFDDGGFSISAASFSSSNSNTRAFAGSGTWSVTSTGTVFTTATNTSLTTSGFTGTIKLTNSSSSSKTWATGGYVGSTINYWNATGSTGVCIFTGSGTLNDIKIDAGRTQQFTAATTTTFTTMTLPVSASNAITITSVTAAQHTLLCNSAAAIKFYGCTISQSKATGTSAFEAYNDTTVWNNVNGGSTSGYRWWPQQTWVDVSNATAAGRQSIARAANF